MHFFFGVVYYDKNFELEKKKLKTKKSSGFFFFGCCLQLFFALIYFPMV
jgi:hypothetical protein